MLDRSTTAIRTRAWAMTSVFAALLSPGLVAAEAPAQPRLERTSLVCEPLGLGAIDSVPYNFPGADERALDALRPFLPGLIETALPAGRNPRVPLIFGGDLGAPFEHSDGRMYFVFDDLEPAPAEGVDTSCASEGSCTPRVTQNDLIATTNQSAAPTPDRCLALSIESAPNDPSQFRPITVDGAFEDGGANLGGGVVPGPAFSTGKYIFMLTPTTQTAHCTIGESGNSCATTGGIEGDVCAPIFGPTEGACYFGECLDSPQSPCALRYPPATLSVREGGSRFVSAATPVHVRSRAVLDAYRGHFATASFFSQVDFETHDGRVWVVGRDSFWAAPGLRMDPYLMVHRVVDGRLEDAQYFAGMQDGEPVFSPDRRRAQPIYREDKLVHNHTSIAYLPEFAGGAWVMLYGGRSQVSIRSALEFFVRPVVDDHFYDPAAGVYLRWAKQPWGPWSEAITIFNAMTPGQGGYCESMHFEDPNDRTDFACPTENAAMNQRLNRRLIGAGMAGEYGVALLPRFTRSGPPRHTVELFWLMSTWNPYRVVLMQTRLSGC